MRLPLQHLKSNTANVAILIEIAKNIINKILQQYDLK